MSESRDYLLTPSPGRPLHAIFVEVCDKYKVTALDMLGRRRPAYLAKPRHEFYWRAYNETASSLPEIGRFIGGRDHTTIMHGIKRHEARMAKVQGAEA